MKIGLVSDSHGKDSRLRKAIDELLARGAEAIVHCGDVKSVEAIELLGESGVPAYVALGNMDKHADRLARAAAESGVELSHGAVRVELGDGRLLAAAHGHDEDALNALPAESDAIAYVCHGHTHRRRDERVGSVRVMNPGALYHPRDGWASAAVLDADADTLEIVRIE